ncbi:MAG: DUF1837 domain-containing protein [Cardiobacteriaceae bacterium]|nr:DUF1837 domain-containing protein [Cardiobacteriaceae bacterium]
MFGSEGVIFDSEIQLSEYVYAYFVGYDIDECYRWKDLIDVIMNALPEFAYGFHQGSATNNTEILKKLRDAARAIYKIQCFKDVSDSIEKNGLGLDDDVEDKYLRRGEFGELILHLLLRDKFETIPLISKIYFKDSCGSTVHGFDCVHIEPKEKTLWLGESKLYIEPLKGLSALIKDLDEHFNCSFLEDEFSLIAKKTHGIGKHACEYNEIIKDRDYWIQLLSSKDYKNTLKKVKIPLICTYTSDIFKKYKDEHDGNFKSEYNAEISKLKKYFDEKFNHAWKSKLEIILILFPVWDKNMLVQQLHNKIRILQEM